MWEVEYTDEFATWWDKCNEAEQEDIDAAVEMLEANGPNLKFPYSSGVNASKFSHMRELRIQHNGEPYRILYAFDPRRVAILLIGGCKTGNDRWYEQHIKIADSLYDAYLIEIAEEIHHD
jgi:hypothetical protein